MIMQIICIICSYQSLDLKNIPSRKKINQDKEDINLADDEYLGEFNLLIYDPRTNVLVTQGKFLWS